MTWLVIILLSIGTGFNIAFADPPISAKETAQASLPPSHFLAIETLRKKIFSSTLLLFRNEKKIAHAVVVDPRGYLLTKASSSVGARIARTYDGKEFVVRIRKRDEPSDLALLEILHAEESWDVVDWSEDQNRTQEGRWVISINQNSDQLIPGIVSGTPRPILREGGVMGAVFMDSNESIKQVGISEVIPHSSADRAGLRIGDIVNQIDGERVLSASKIYDLIKKKDPGDLMVLKISRREKDHLIRVTLGHRSVVFDLFNRNLLMSGPVSKRKDSFPLVLQHDLPLRREMMGGGLFDPWGNCLGLNIARVDRVTNYALPTNEIIKVIKPWLANLP